MKKRIISVLAVAASTLVLYSVNMDKGEEKQPIIVEPTPIVHYVERSYILEDTFLQLPEVPIQIIEEVEPVDEPSLTNEEIELIALVTMAEAEGECELGKRLVIDTILNRVDSEHFPNTVNEVIYQPKHFSSMWDGRVDECEVTDYICQLVVEELESRENSDVMYFHAGKYGKWGNPMFNVENHYFSSY